jgi:hypothetical protein
MFFWASALGPREFDRSPMIVNIPEFRLDAGDRYLGLD